jgi:clan AA aspartic protease (TIGR02281 family)
MKRVAAAVLALSVLLACESHAEWTAGGGSEVPLDGNGNSWLVRATLNGNVTGTFLVDTGATLCVVGPTTARRLGIAPTGEQIELRTANGVVHAPVIRLRTVDLGGNRARDVSAVVHDSVPPPIDGIIGLSYLNNFTYAVDPRRRVLRLH